MSKLDKKLNESSDTQIKRLASLPANKICFDCDQRGPTYVNLTIGSFICMKCSGIIRGLNPPHRVKSISMATFSQKELTFLENTGNAYCQKIWLGLYDSQTDSQHNNLLNEHSSIEGQKEFLIDKYEKKMWYVAPEELIQQIEREKELGLHKDKKTSEASVKTGSSASFSSTDVAIIERQNTGQNQMVGRGEDNHSSSTNTSATSNSSFAILSSSDQGSTNTNYDMENNKKSCSYSLMQHKGNKNLMLTKKLPVNHQGSTTNSLASVKGAPDSISMFLSSSAGNDGNGGTNSPNNFVSTDEDGFCILDHNPSPTPSQQSGTKSTINQKLSAGRTNNTGGMLGEMFEDNFDTNSEEPFYASKCNKSNNTKQRTQQPSYLQSVTTAFHIAKPPPSNSCKKTVSLNATPGTDCYLVRRNRKTSLNETSLKNGKCSVLPIPTSNCSSDSVTSSLNSLNLNNNVVNNNHIISGFTHILFSNENGDDKVNSDTKPQNGSGEIINTKFKTSSETFDHSNGTTAELEINQKSVSSSTSYSDYASLSSFSPKTQDGLFALKPPHQPLTKRKISLRSNGGLSSVTHITNHSSKDRVDKIFDNKTRQTQHFEDDFAINHGEHMPVENGKHTTNTVIDGPYVADPFVDCGHIATLTNGIHPIPTTQSSNNPSNLCNKDILNNNNISVLHSTSVPPAERYSALAELDEAFHATKIHSDTLNDDDSALFGTTTNYHNSALPPFGNDVNHSTLGSVADLKAIKNPFLVPLPVTNPVLTNHTSQITQNSVWPDPTLSSINQASANNSQNLLFNSKSKCQSQSNGSLRNSVPALESRAFNGIEQPIPSRIMDKTYWPLSDSQQQKPSSQIDLFALKKNYSQNNSDSSTQEALSFFESFSTNNGGVNVTSYDNHPPNYGQHHNNNIYHHNKSHSDFQTTNGWENHINFNHTQNNNTSSSCFNGTNYNNRSIAMVKPVSPTNPFL